MKLFKVIIYSIVLLSFFTLSTASVSAQRPTPSTQPSTSLEATEAALLDQATSSALTATESAEASASARIQETIDQKSATDITETQGEVKSRLAQFLEINPIGPLTPINFVQHALRRAVDAGVPANMLVLMLMFPLIASIIAVSRHVVGLEGFGVYTPAVLAVAFLSTGIVTGLVIFLVILTSAMIGKILIGYFKLEYLPRTALLLWFVSLAVFGLLLVSPYLVGYVNLVAVGIFPILVLILLSETLMESKTSQSRLIELTLETLVLAIGSALLMRLDVVQEFVILHPELTILGVAFIDIAVGRYTGLRVSEYFRFKPIMEEEE